MAQRIVCPRCNRTSYTTAPEIYGPCPYCAFVFNWKSPDRRVFKRTEKIAPLTVEMNGKKHNAEFVDLSKRGAGIILHGHPFLKKGAQLTCTFKDVKTETRKSKVVWSHETDGDQKAGLLFI